MIQQEDENKNKKTKTNEPTKNRKKKSPGAEPEAWINDYLENLQGDS